MLGSRWVRLKGILGFELGICRRGIREGVAVPELSFIFDIVLGHLLNLLTHVICFLAVDSTSVG